MLALRFSTLERTIKRNSPIRDEWGYSPEYRCNWCERAFAERDIEVHYRPQDDESRCPHCGSTDWGDNDEPIKARVTRRWSIKFHKRMERAA